MSKKTTITGSLDYRGTAPPVYGQNVQFSPVAGSSSRIITALGTGYCGDTDPGAANVLNTAANYWVNGVMHTPTATVPAAAKVYSGTHYGVGGNGSTGTLHASNLHSGAGAPGVDLTVAVLKSGVTVDNVTGTYDPVTGNYTDPGKDNVLTGHNYTFGGVTQTAMLTLPTASQVIAGVSFGVAGNGTTGIVTLPPQGKVQNDTSYGAAGTQFTGTIDLTCCIPSNIKNNVVIAGVTGTVEPSATGMLTLYD